MPVFAPSQTIDARAAVEAIRDLYARRPSAGVASGRVIARDDGARLRALVAVDGDLMCAKAHAQGSSGDSAFLLALFDARDARLVALLDGRAVTAARTGATSALAVDLLAPPGPIRLGVLGSGVEARAHVRAVAAVRELEFVSVFSPTAERREAFAAELGGEAAGDARSVVESSPVVICAARAQGERPVLAGEWLQDDAVVVSIGSTVPDQRELDVATLERAALIVADEPAEVLSQSGDCLAAAAEGVRLEAKTIPLGVPIGAVDGIRVFKSVGSALQDLAVARTLLDDAGTVPLPFELTGKSRDGLISSS
jgi:alanine dehydrogenase